MTAKSARPATPHRPHGLLAIGLAMAIGAPFATYLPWRFGSWPEVEFPIIFLHAAAAVCALAMFIEAMSVDSRRSTTHVWDAIWSAPVMICAAIAMWSAAMAPFARFPWLSIVGAPQTADGAVLWLDIATLIAATRLFTITEHGRRAIVTSLFILAYGLPLLSLFPETRPIWFSDYLAFLGLATAAAIPGFAAPRDAPVTTKHAILGILAAIPSFIVAGNQTAALIFPALFLPAYVAGAILLRHPSRARFVRAAYALGVVGIILGAPVLVTKIGATDAIKSIQSRDRINSVLQTRLYDDPTIWITGRGWGHTQRDFEELLSQANAKIWDKSWDAPQRDVFHSHNGFFEALLSAGAPAAAGAVIFVMAAALFSPPRMLALAGGFALGYAALSSLWFQFSLTIPATALAFAALSCRLSFGPRTKIKPVFLIIFLGLTCAVQIFTSAKLAIFAIDVIAAEARADQFILGKAGSKLKCGDFPDDSWRDDIFLSHQLGRHLRNSRRMSTATPVDSPVFRTIGSYYCIIENKGLERGSQPLLRNALVAQSEFAFLAQFAPLRDLYPYNGVTWTRLADAYLDLAPKRTDVMLPYLAWLLQKKEAATLDRSVHKILTLNANDPVGLWFSGLSSLMKPGKAHRTRGIEALRKSIEFGIEKWTPVPTQIRSLLQQSD
ncbi:MAG: hypothetical protein HOM25_00490 [Rhodospirillaceae bacterium]|nr:hypothetical protein [Rhodospirillaceae bacterium]MBT5812362.1 hypothetical protein [Rhodospirillaceae bacterium]